MLNVKTASAEGNNHKFIFSQPYHGQLLCLVFLTVWHHPSSIHTHYIIHTIYRQKCGMKTSSTRWRPTHLQTGTKAFCFTWLTPLTGHEAWVRPSHTGCHTATWSAAGSAARVSDSSHGSSVTQGKWCGALIESGRLNKSQRRQKAEEDGGGGESGGNGRPTPRELLRCESAGEMPEEHNFSESHSPDRGWGGFQSKGR